jgi:tricorn protease
MAENQFRQVKLFSIAENRITPVTTDRYDSYSPAWSPDGKWIYFLSDRNLKTVVQSPGAPTSRTLPRQEDENLSGSAAPRAALSFAPVDELHPAATPSARKKSSPARPRSRTARLK